jgi:hypothetical protein
METKKENQKRKPKKNKKTKVSTVAGLLKNGQNKCPKSRNELLDEHRFLKISEFASP